MLKKIQATELDGNVFDRISKQWMLVTAGDRKSCNTMTASWGGLGFLWNRPVATIYIRPQRYTREFLDRTGWFSLSFLPEKYRDELTLCGQRSGRDIDKMERCGFSVSYGQNDTPYVGEAEMVFICRILYMDPLNPASFLDPEVAETYYPEKDWSRIYIGEIVEALKEIE